MASTSNDYQPHSPCSCARLRYRAHPSAPRPCRAPRWSFPTLRSIRHWPGTVSSRSRSDWDEARTFRPAQTSFGAFERFQHVHDHEAGGEIASFSSVHHSKSWIQYLLSDFSRTSRCYSCSFICAVMRTHKFI